MVANPNLNQINQTPFQGNLDLQFPGNTITVQVASTQATPLIAGQAVKVVSTAGGVPKVVALAADTDIADGFVSRNQKDLSYPALSYVEMTTPDSVMWMTANGAITRWTNVEVANAALKVGPSLGINPVVGFAYDAAAADGDLIRVWVNKAAGLGAGLRSYQVTATLAEINAGKTILPAVAGKKLRVTNFTNRNVGAFATGTSVRLQSSATSVIVADFLEAAIGASAVLVPGSANVTLGAGYSVDLPVGEGLVVANNGAAQTGGTSQTYTLTYQYV